MCGFYDRPAASPCFFRAFSAIRPTASHDSRHLRLLTADTALALAQSGRHAGVPAPWIISVRHILLIYATLPIGMFLWRSSAFCPSCRLLAGTPAGDAEITSTSPSYTRPGAPARCAHIMAQPRSPADRTPRGMTHESRRKRCAHPPHTRCRGSPDDACAKEKARGGRVSLH